MTPEERQMLVGLFERVRASANGPKDAEAESFIAGAMRETPSAGYVLAQTVLVQGQALENASKRIQDLEAQLKAGAGAEEHGSFLGNLGRNLFGGGAAAAPPAQPQGYNPGAAPQRPAYAPQAPAYAPQAPAYAPAPPQAGPWGASPGLGGGFLSGALQTATGVAGGVLLGDAIGGLFGGHHGGLFGGGGFGGGFGGGEFVTDNVHETVVNNYYGGDAGGPGVQDSSLDMDPDVGDYGGGGGDDYNT